MNRESQKTRKKGWIEQFSNALKKNKKLELFVYGVVVCVVLLIYVSTLFAKDEQPDAAVVSAGTAMQTQSEQQTEQRLKQVLSSIRGAGRVEVMITYETSKELVPAMSVDTNINHSENIADSGRSSSSQQETQSTKPATISGNGGSEPIVLMERQPTIRGVIVVAEGAADVAVRLNLQHAVQTVLDVPASNIEVFELAGNLNE